MQEKYLSVSGGSVTSLSTSCLDIIILTWCSSKFSFSAFDPLLIFAGQKESCIASAKAEEIRTT